MGMFDLFFAGKKEPPTPCPRNENEAICVLLFACVYADGQLRDAESDYISRALTWKSWFSPGEVSEYLLPVVTSCKTTPIEALIERAGLIVSERRRKTVFAMACDVIMSDGVVDKSELNILEKVGQALMMKPEDAKAILEIMFLRNLDNKIMIN